MLVDDSRTPQQSSNIVHAGVGTMLVKGGSGADTYGFGVGNGLMMIADFSVPKGDTLTIDKSPSLSELIFPNSPLTGRISMQCGV